MWSSQHGSSLSNLPKDHSSLRLACLDMQLLVETRQYFDTLLLIFLSINKDSAAVVVALEGSRCRSSKYFLIDLQLDRSCSRLALIDETRKCKASTNARKEAQFSIANDLHPFLANLEFAFAGSVVAPCTEAEIFATHLDILLDPSIASTVQDSTISCVCSSWKYE